MSTEYESYLVHHGIKGQKWGVRRYQNEDGSVTKAGAKRYYLGNRSSVRAPQQDTPPNATVEYEKPKHNPNATKDGYQDWSYGSMRDSTNRKFESNRQSSEQKVRKLLASAAGIAISKLRRKTNDI